ncbi:MAG: hypothetical protein K2X81_06290, partial [Candidatus Obscuribacterales bacterium]|nr:hypothetical protein [Candidatus Obscuribacterales bacterium]
LRFNTVRKNGADVLGDGLAKELAGKNVYITIDKDVLQESDAITDWDQGEMKLSELLSIVSRVADSANLVGVDVCGERAPQAIQGLLKSIDCGREFKRHIKDWDHVNSVNQTTNIDIVHSIEHAISGTKNVKAIIEPKPARK